MPFGESIKGFQKAFLIHSTLCKFSRALAVRRKQGFLLQFDLGERDFSQIVHSTGVKYHPKFASSGGFNQESHLCTLKWLFQGFSEEYCLRSEVYICCCVFCCLSFIYWHVGVFIDLIVPSLPAIQPLISHMWVLGQKCLGIGDDFCSHSGILVRGILGSNFKAWFLRFWG